MKNPLKTDRSTNLGLLLGRLPMGLFILLAGVFKLQGGAAAFASANASKIPSWAPQDLGHQYLRAIPYMEVAVGAMLIFGLLSRVAGLVGALMIASFTIAITGWREPKPFDPNLIFIGLMLVTFLTGPGGISVDGALFGKKSKSNFQSKD